MALFQCDHCGHQQPVADEHAGKRGRCPDCGALSRIVDESLSVEHDSGGTEPGVLRRWGGFIALMGGILVLTSVWTARNLRTVDSGSKLVSGGSIAPSEKEESTARDSGAPANNIENLTNHGESIEVAESRGGPQEQNAKLAGRSSGSTDAVPSPTKSDQVPALVAEVAKEEHSSTVKENPEPPPAVTPRNDEAKAVDRVALARQFKVGKELFEHEWKPHEHGAGKGDGLGPVFNGRSCVECHFQSGTGGSGTNAHNVHSFEVMPLHEGGDVRTGVIHASAIQTSLVESRDALSQLLGSPTIPLQDNSSRQIKVDAIRNVWINTPALWGNGLIDRITDQQLIQLENNQALTGRFRRLSDGAIGKFGWKSQIATLREFVGAACATELGLTNSIRQQHLPKKYDVNAHARLDLSDDQLASLVSFVDQLPAPRQVIPQDPGLRAKIEEGHKLFSKIGCAACHIEDIGPIQGIFSDFRLHEMTPIAFSRVRSTEAYYIPPTMRPIYVPPPYQPKLAEWKTPPLWGVADTAPYWHDGSAATLTEAILNHSHDGTHSREEFRQLDKDRQEQLLAFLGSLKAPIDVAGSFSAAVVGPTVSDLLVRHPAGTMLTTSFYDQIENRDDGGLFMAR